MQQPCVVLDQGDALNYVPSPYDPMHGMSEFLDNTSNNNISDLRLLNDYQEHQRDVNIEYRHLQERFIQPIHDADKTDKSDFQIKDSHLTYQVEGLQPHEMPVIGTYVDPRIAPGFRYTVRLLGRKESFLFKGDALHLQTIGRGYGKRLTFESEHKNINDNYFWSDTRPKGYAFSLTAVQPKDCFIACDSNKRPFAKVAVDTVSERQIEVSTYEDGGILTKRILVCMILDVHYTCGPHGLMPLRCDEKMQVVGLAIVQKGAKFAKTGTIERVNMPGLGNCTLVADDVAP